ncbi:hypothetical protein VTL71DRAFT_6238 [Oculimacula yallundae]|uniref:CorA-like transporter domain-containing protein n=1 Tax=Oculimacula yallundae TaxID=86028 RepID=A0ABR4C196_9HELO
MSPEAILDDSMILHTQLDERAHNLFKSKTGTAPFQVTRVVNNEDSGVASERGNFTRLVRDIDVCDLAQLKVLRNLEDCTQIFTVGQDRSWTTLNISQDIFESFMKIYEITPHFWKHLLTFGRKSGGNEFQFPGFSRCRSSPSDWESPSKYELSYMLRRVELNGRTEEHGESPWSIRQTAIYHQIICQQGAKSSFHEKVAKASHDIRSTFLLITPSTGAKAQLTQFLQQDVSRQMMVLSCWNIHKALIADSLTGWSDYLAFLQGKLKIQSNIAVFGNMSEDLSLNSAHRQELKVIEDQVLDVQVILPSLIDSISGIRETCVRFGARHLVGESRCIDLEEIIDDFKGYEKAVSVLSNRAETLKATAESTAKLLSDLLTYEEGVSLRVLAAATQRESHLMYQMAEKGTKDAAAVKILTVIFLLYLPTTIIANFFSTEFVKMGENDQVQVSRNVWLLAAISIPFTLLTFVLWWAWVHFTKVEAAVSDENPDIPMLKRKHSIRSTVSLKKGKPTLDLESGLRLPSQVSTWNSTRTATTVKFG